MKGKGEAVLQLIKRSGGAFRECNCPRTTLLASQAFERTRKYVSSGSSEASVFPMRNQKRKICFGDLDGESDYDAGWGLEGLEDFLRDEQSNKMASPGIGRQKGEIYNVSPTSKRTRDSSCVSQ